MHPTGRTDTDDIQAGHNQKFFQIGKNRKSKLSFGFCGTYRIGIIQSNQFRSIYFVNCLACFPVIEPVPIIPMFIILVV